MNPRRGHIDERTIADAENDREAALLRYQGQTYPQIAAIQGCAVSTAYERTWRAIRSAPVEAGEELRSLELARLDVLIGKAWEVLVANHPLVSNGKRFDDLQDAGPVLAAIRELRQLSESRRKLLGLDAPAKATITVINEDVVEAEIARLEADLAARPAADSDRSTS